jgi:hypothetical protein
MPQIVQVGWQVPSVSVYNAAHQRMLNY